MVARNRKEDGQAIFEFIIFLPLMLFMFTVIFTIGNSINGSINQQKATRRYFFHIAKGNSTIPGPWYLSQIDASVSRIGTVSVGWREKESSGGDSYATCYPLVDFFSDNKDDDCFNPSIKDKKSNFVRIYTQFGVCGESFVRHPSGAFFLPDYGQRANGNSCTIR